MAWPPTTHQDVQDEVTPLRLAHRDYFRSGYYSTGHFTSITTSTSTIPTSGGYARPFIVGAQRAFDRIGVNVSTAATTASGGLIQLAIYQPGAGMPGALLLQTGTVSSETTGAKEFVISTTLDPGIWWLAVRTAVASCSVTSFFSGEMSSPFVSALTAPPTNNNTQASWQFASATFPDPFSSGNPVVAGIFPFVSLRAT